MFVFLYLLSDNYEIVDYLELIVRLIKEIGGIRYI